MAHRRSLEKKDREREGIVLDWDDQGKGVVGVELEDGKGRGKEGEVR